MNITSVYFYRAIFDALYDIKKQWARLRNKLRFRVMQNANLNDSDRQYICWILKHPKLYAHVLQRKRLDLPVNFQDKQLNTRRLHNLVCRLTRKYKEVKCHADRCNSFGVTNRAYKYVSGGIKISTKFRNQRIFIPLTDKNQYDMQLLLKFDSNNRIVLHVPVQQRIHQNVDFTNQIEIRFGYATMLDIINGRTYGGRLGQFMSRETTRLKQKHACRQKLFIHSKQCVKDGDNRKALRILQNNLGIKKYLRQKQRADAMVKGYINAQLNRMIQLEKPKMISIPKFREIAYKQVPCELRIYLSRWLRGYIRQRLEYKCVQNDIKLIEIKMNDGYLYNEFKKNAFDTNMVKTVS